MPRAKRTRAKPVQVVLGAGFFSSIKKIGKGIKKSGVIGKGLQLAAARTGDPRLMSAATGAKTMGFGRRRAARRVIRR